MKSSILSIALALSMLAVVFVSVPTTASVYYTGSVMTTDIDGEAKEVFFIDENSWQGDRIYVGVELFYMGEPYNGDILVELYGPDGDSWDWFYAWTGDTTEGVYNSWTDTPVDYLHVNPGILDGALMGVCDVVVYVDDGVWVEFARTQVIVKSEGLYLSPGGWYYTYYPGQSVDVTLVTRETADFYIQVVNYTDSWTIGDTFQNYTNNEALDGVFTMIWEVGDNPDGLYAMNVRSEEFDDVWYTIEFYIQTYEFFASSDRYYVLPGETVQVAYEVIDLATMTPSTGVTIELNKGWYNESGNWTMISGSLSESSGTFDVEIPTNIAMWSYVYINMWANGSDDERSVQESWAYSLGVLAGDVEVDDVYYYAGETVEVDVWAWVQAGYDWAREYLPGADVEVEVTFDGEPTDYDSSGVTDAMGWFGYEFDITTDSPEGSYLVNATISILDYEILVMTSFDVYATGWLEVETDRDFYYSGETMWLTFTAWWNEVEVNGTPVHAVIYDTYSWLPIASGDTTTGTLMSYDIPDDFTGELYVDATANMDGWYLWGSMYVDVYAASLVLVPEKTSYRPGDTVTWWFEVVADAANGTLSYTVWDDEDNEVASGALGALSSGSFGFAVPNVGSAPYYVAELEFVADDGWTLTRSSTVYRTDDFEVSLWLETKSKFTSKAFEPGTDLTFGFEVAAYEQDEPRTYRVYFYVSGAEGSFYQLVNAGEGTFEYAVPDDATDGWYYVEIDLYDAVTGEWLSSDYVEYEVLANQSTWDRSVGGMALVDFMIMLLIVIMIVVMIVLPFVKGRMGAPKTPEPAPPPAEPKPPA